METVKVELKPNNKKSAPLSEFLTESLLVEFATGALSGFRKEQIQSLIESDPVFKEKYQNVLLSLSYCEQIGEIEFTESHLAEISGKNAWWIQALSLIHWRSWPGPLRWAVQAIAISGLTAFFVVNIPWKKVPLVKGFIGPQTVELAKIDRNPPIDSEISGSDEILLAANDGDFENQESGAEPTAVAGASDAKSVSAGAGVAASEISTKNDSKANDSKKDNLEKPDLRKQDLAEKSILEEAEDSKGQEDSTQKVSQKSNSGIKENESSEKEQKKAGLQGFIYRSYAKFANLEQNSPKIVKKIKDLGGAKAGQVKLGWERKGGRYFHFSLPEENEKEFLDFLKQFGSFSVSKDEHRRVMPEGILRYILWIEPKLDKALPKSE